MFAIIGALLLFVVFVITILLICGLPLGEFTMGGQSKVLSPSLRIVALVFLLIQIFAILIILQAGGFLSLWFSAKVTGNICIGYAIYLSLNTIMNFFSRSKKEKYVMTPLSLAATICFWLTVFQM